MFFKTASRINPQTGKLSIYYRLVENSHNVVGGFTQRSLQSVGFMDDVSTEELHHIADGLNDRINSQGRLMEDNQIEGTIQTLKSDLDLRPISHKTDDASQAHLHLGMMAYWVVNTIRHQLKERSITSDWRELVQVMNTQKCVATSLTNDKGQRISKAHPKSRTYL